MIPERDLDAFVELWTDVCGAYNRPAPSVGSVLILLGVLRDYTLEQVREAVGAHMSNTDTGRHCPTAADLLSHLKGPAPDAGRVMPNAYLEFEPEDPYALPALPLTPSERERLETERRERLAEEKRRVREMLKGSGIGRAFPAEPKQRERDERMTAPVDDGPMVRTGPDGKMQFRCADGRWC